MGNLFYDGSTCKTAMKLEKIPLVSKAPVLCLAYNSDQGILAVGQLSDSNKRPCLSLWNLSSRKSIQLVEDNIQGSIWAMSFDYTGRRLIYSDNTHLFILEVSSNRKQAIEGDHKRINSIVSSMKSPRVIVSGARTEVLNIETGEQLWNLTGYHGFDTTENLEIQELPHDWNISEQLNFKNAPAAVEILRTGEIILVGGHNKGTIEMIEISDGRLLKTIRPAPIQTYWMSLGCNETVLAVSSKIPYASFLWSLENGERILPDLFNERFGGYSSICLHSTKRLMASGSLVGFVSLRDLDNGNFLFSEQLHESRVSQIILSERTNTIFSGGEDGEVRIIEFDI
jgi:WD40 repeat protein